MSDIAIKAEHLSKYYRLGVINNGTLFKDLQTWIARKRGKEDPHSKIGEHKYDGTDDGFWALKDLNFEIKQGDRVGIIGKNGAGKSTLLKILSRITAPTEGCVKIHGRVASLLEVGTGFHGELTGRENVYLNGAILGMKKKEVDRKIDEIIDFSGIEKHIDTPVKRYSSGMYVRLAFAVAAHLDSEILIADEVLAVGDAEFQKKALGKMNELSMGEGRTVLFVSHNIAAVKGLCNRGVILNHGKMIFSGNISDAITSYLSNSIGISSSSFKEFPTDNRKAFQINSVHVIDRNDNTLETFESQEIIKLRLICTSRKALPGLYGYFVIYNAERMPIIIFDSNETETDMLANLAPGKYTFDIILPPGILAGNSTYTFYANFTSIYNIEDVTVDSPLDICTFNVTDSLSKRGNNREAVTAIIPKMKKVNIGKII